MEIFKKTVKVYKKGILHLKNGDVMYILGKIKYGNLNKDFVFSLEKYTGKDNFPIKNSEISYRFLSNRIGNTYIGDFSRIMTIYNKFFTMGEETTLFSSQSQR